MSVPQRRPARPSSRPIDQDTVLCPECGRRLADIIAWIDAQEGPLSDRLSGFPRPLDYVLACLLRIS